MGDFKVGDRVRVTHIAGNSNNEWVGGVGILRAAPEGDYWEWRVTGPDFEDATSDHLAVHGHEIEKTDE